MRIKNEQFTTGDIYQFMTGQSRKSYEVMPPFTKLTESLLKRAKLHSNFADKQSVVNSMIITDSPFEDNENGVDFIIFINSELFLKANDMTCGTCDYFTHTAHAIYNRWKNFSSKNPKAFIDRVILIDGGVIVPESSIGGQPVCMELYKHYYSAPNDISIDFESSSFHQYAQQRYYFGEEFREYLDSSDTDINDAICGYLSVIIPMYLSSISYGNYIEDVIYKATSDVMRIIEEE